ncbi:hypothetical protein BKA82DRAFT_3977752 [Pisolithus tinctorius]|nr:hypothetical protein BKA82DRAFT_3986340 [Pisolithus tinctorius]KAI6148925.1 hypothetical protein BKA82DRAFT_3977752 [Pisolithus tinctorius]
MAESQSDDGQPSGDKDALHVAHCRSKRRIAALELELETMRASSKKSHRCDSYVHRGRAIRRLVTLYENVEDLIAAFDRHQEFQENDHNESDLENTCDDDRLYKSFEELITVLPWMKKIVLRGTADELEDICKQLQKGADGARGDDTANLKQDIVSWLTDLFHPIEPPLRTTTKDERGFVHDVTGKLICPAEFDWDLAIVKDGIRDRNPSYLVTAYSWPLFLYENFEFYSTDAERGLFRSSLLIKAFKFIFTSPSSIRDLDEDRATPGRRRGSSNQKAATKNHVRFALSSANTWHNVDGDFDYSQFYNTILDFFEDLPGPAAKKRVDELLAWWNHKAFGKNRPITLPVAAVKKSSVSQLAAQHLAKEVE